jgi:hypothetical protein
MMVQHLGSPKGVAGPASIFSGVGSVCCGGSPIPHKLITRGQIQYPSVTTNSPLHFIFSGVGCPWYGMRL